MASAARYGVDQLEKAVAIARIALEYAAEARRHSRDAMLAHTAHRHALVLGFDQDCDAARRQNRLDGAGDLCRQLLLRLQAAGEDLDDAGELRQADHAVARQVGDMRHADERRDMVLAMALHADVAQHDHVVVAADVLERARQGLGWVGTLGVRPPWRKHGLGMALLKHSFAELYQRGYSTIGLTVDASNPTGATRLYERAGMHIASQFIVYEKEYRPGREPEE